MGGLFYDDDRRELAWQLRQRGGWASTGEGAGVGNCSFQVFDAGPITRSAKTSSGFQGFFFSRTSENFLQSSGKLVIRCSPYRDIANISTKWFFFTLSSPIQCRQE